MIGIAPAVASRTSLTMRAVWGQSALPERPPVPVDTRVSETARVFEHVRASAPASCAMRASDSTTSRSTSVMKGGSFTSSGREVPTRRASTNDRRWASLSRSRPHVTLGQLAFSSIASAWGASRSSEETASSSASSAMLTNRGAEARSRSRCWAATSAPGLGRPIAFTIERVVGDLAIRGLGLPARAALVIVPPTT